MSMDKVVSLANRFALNGVPAEYKECKTGHINSTFFVTTDSGDKYVIQKINKNVFKKPDEVMANICGVTEYLKKLIVKNGGDPERETLTVIPAKDGKAFYEDEVGDFWRAYLCIKDAKTEDKADSPELFELVGEAFGNFQYMLSGYDASALYEAIPNFHNTKNRFANFMKALEENKSKRAFRCENEIAFVKGREDKCSLIVDGIAQGRIPLRVTHNDTKLNNIMLDSRSGLPLAVIDLDTVMPGSLLYDFGDAIRFGASSAAEDETDLDKVFVVCDMFDAFAKGYIRGLNGSATEEEIRLLPLGAYLITLENGIRFLTDYLDGDNYFRTEYPEHNLDRARNQFKLVADMEAKEGVLNEIISKYIN